MFLWQNMPFRKFPLGAQFPFPRNRRQLFFYCPTNIAIILQQLLCSIYYQIFQKSRTNIKKKIYVPETGLQFNIHGNKYIYMAWKKKKKDQNFDSKALLHVISNEFKKWLEAFPLYASNRPHHWNIWEIWLFNGLKVKIFLRNSIVPSEISPGENVWTQHFWYCHEGVIYI